MFSFSSFRFCFSLFNSLVSYTHSAGGNCVFPDFSSVVKSPYYMLAEPRVPSLLPLSRWLCFMVCDSLTNVCVLPWHASPMKAGSLSLFHFLCPQHPSKCQAPASTRVTILALFRTPDNFHLFLLALTYIYLA